LNYILGSASITNCTISGNSALSTGGGLRNCDVTITNCTISGNSAKSTGGLFGCDGVITNCTISDNSAELSGGGLRGCDGAITNCTIYGNSAGSSGGGLDICDAIITNCIIWNNTSSVPGYQLNDSSTPTYSCIQDWIGGGQGNITSEPYFADAANGDYHLQMGSLCINAGDQAGDYSGQFDIDGQPRVMCNRVDIGADEFEWLYAGDFAGGCDIDLADFAVLAASWQTDNPAIDIAPIGNPDGVIDIKELMVLAKNWLKAEDITPPTPDPMTWDEPPAATGEDSIAMTASVATDDLNDVEYYFTCTAGGGHDSGWRTDTYYEDTGLTIDTEYTYTVTARDTSRHYNETAPSTEMSAFTDPDIVPPTPDPMTWALAPTPGGSVSVLIALDPATGVTASSEIAAPYDRKDDYIVDGSGLTAGSHSQGAEGSAWLSSGNGFGGIDPDPSVTFDLGAVYVIDSFNVWNYNEAGFLSRGVNSVSVEYGTTAGLGSTVAGITNFAQATGLAGYTGEAFDTFTPFSARYIKFDINSNHGDGNSFYGLSEVQFYGYPDPPASRATSVSMIATTATDISGVEYYFECTAGSGDDSGWQDSVIYTNTGLTPSTTYTYKVMARDKSALQNATGWSTSESATTD
jgi:hypothetical protein